MTLKKPHTQTHLTIGDVMVATGNFGGQAAPCQTEMLLHKRHKPRAHIEKAKDEALQSAPVGKENEKERIFKFWRTEITYVIIEIFLT